MGDLEIWAVPSPLRDFSLTRRNPLPGQSQCLWRWHLSGGVRSGRSQRTEQGMRVGGTVSES